MPDPALEMVHLSQANRHITEGENRITRQALLIDKMGRNGQDVTEANRLLVTFRETLVVWQAHRAEILRALAQGGAVPPAA